MSMLWWLLVAALACAVAQLSSPRKMFVYSNTNTRGPNRVLAYSFFYVRLRPSCRVTRFFVLSPFWRPCNRARAPRFRGCETCSMRAGGEPAGSPRDARRTRHFGALSL